MDYLYWQATDKSTLKRINTLLIEIERTPYEGSSKPEPLKYQLTDGGQEGLTRSIGWYTKQKKIRW